MAWVLSLERMNEYSYTAVQGSLTERKENLGKTGRGKRGGGGGGAYPFLSHLTIGHASLSRRSMGGGRFQEEGRKYNDLFRTAVPFWGQTTQNLSRMSPKRVCGPKRENNLRGAQQSVSWEQQQQQTWSIVGSRIDGKQGGGNRYQVLLWPEISAPFDIGLRLQKVTILSRLRKVIILSGRAVNNM